MTLGFSLTAQTELVSPEGVHVLIDVSDPSKVVEPVTDKDILLTTHSHPDHTNVDFISSFPGRQLAIAGNLESGDVKITGLATVHNEGDEPGTDYLFILDIGDLRVVHFGDIGLAALPADQLAAVGDIDIAITQFDNAYSDVDSNNQKGFKLIEQLQPRLVIPTHQTDRSVPLMTRWSCLYSDHSPITVTSDQLPTTTTVLFMGAFAAGQGSATGALAVDW